ncbi:MAG: low-specificity L-threonine aldolase [Bacteroidetes bacterium]|nr:low-specificity L-threonine aldolase [Bacteroidota bacterium]MCL5025924.1 low-specificity L-threonine aldolase [Chloroflexota bacterium]
MASKVIDLRSDTVTLPTEAMRRAMYEAELGDDNVGEDPTANKLQEMAAERMGKEAALLVTSGTQGNLVGILSHTQHGDEVIVGDEAHCYLYEQAGGAFIGGLQMRPVPNHRGHLDPKEVEAVIRDPDNIHFPRTSLLCLENTHNRGSGAVLSVQETKDLADVAHRRGLAVHLDGARIFNAAVALGVPPKQLTADVDSVTFCLSKGLSCPVGSLICGSVEYIARARRMRKLLGSGMRQAGIIAACGVVALNEMVDRLAEDHANAKVLANGLANIPAIVTDPGIVDTNIVFFDVPDVPPAEFLKGCLEHGLRFQNTAGRRYRMVTHYGIERADIDAALSIVSRVLAPVQAPRA